MYNAIPAYLEPTNFEPMMPMDSYVSPVFRPEPISNLGTLDDHLRF